MVTYNSKDEILIYLLSGRCNYCFITKPLSTNRKYCKECEDTARYCRKCDKPKSLQLFTKTPHICNICCNRSAIHMRSGNLSNQVAIDEIDYSHKDDLLYALQDAEGPIRQRVMTYRGRDKELNIIFRSRWV